MQLLESLAMIFFRTFGITQPSDLQRRRAAWFLLALLVVMVVGVTAIGLLLYHLMHA